MESKAQHAYEQKHTANAFPLAEILAGRIRTNGPITFAEFMEACLYHPEHGYYSHSEAKRFADYYTSVDMHPIFGRLLARQLSQMWEVLGRPAEFTAVECGAGPGRLAGHILDFAARALPEFYSALRYVAVERSVGRRKQNSIPDFKSQMSEKAERPIQDSRFKMQEHSAVANVHGSQFSSAESLAAAASGIVGCILSNELLDALPVHRVVQQSGELREIFVARKGDAFVDHIAEPSTPRLAEYFAEQGILLPEGAQAEVCLAALDWIAQAANALDRGFVLTIDYGHEARELYNERHGRGTLLAYHQHRASEDYYARPGAQDLTAHVTFSALDHWGCKAGLRRVGMVSQSHFLIALGRGNEFADLYDEGMSETERVRARLQLKSLIYPEGMGETFSVLVQAKNVAEGVKLAGLEAL